MTATLEICPRRGGLILARRDLDVLLSRAEVAPHTLPASLEPLRGAELQAVFTPPAFRRQGHAQRLLTEVEALLVRLDVDVGVLTCRSELAPFYAASGWERVAHGRGPAAEGPARRMVLLCSARARARRVAVHRACVEAR